MTNGSTKLVFRDNYIDFLRGVGLLLLVVAHTWAPEPIRIIRTFDVPLMVFISAMCYKSGGRFWEYLKKRIIRIYNPVFIFLTLFFFADLLKAWICGHFSFSISQVVGSYLLLNEPSIGFVWIMRVFILIALIIPILYPLVRKISLVGTLFIIGSLILIQQMIVWLTNGITSYYISIIVNETIPYLIGYAPFVILGIKSNQLTLHQNSLIMVLSGCACVVFYVITNDYDPQLYKYPPHSLYILYGIFGCSFMLWLRPYVINIVDFKVWQYLSKNSMWLYLWHIVLIYLISPSYMRPENWGVRYLVVLGGALTLNFAYERLLRIIAYVRFKISDL
jgi:fucose 4-O-acetylase-like acetyltransferase